MKMYRLVLGLMALAVMSVSCAKQSDGGVVFKLDADLGVLEQTRSNVSDYTTLPSTGDFTIVITKSNGDEVYNGLLSAYDETTPLKAGNYTVKASYGSTSEEGFDKPCFQGQKEFSITGDNTTTVTIPVTLANSIIKVYCTDAFRAYFQDWSFAFTTGSGSKIEFRKNESRAAFVEAYKLSVAGTLTDQGGKIQTFGKAYDTVLSPKTCYTIKFDVSNVGSISTITITFDDTKENESVDIELNN